MGIREQRVIEGIKVERKRLNDIKKADLTYQAMSSWREKANNVMQRGEGILGPNNVRNPINYLLSGYQTVSDLDELDEVRSKIIQHLDKVITQIDASQTVRPILDDLILRVKDTKLSTLLNEFNAAKNAQPNIAAVGFRTVLCLVIQERAKIKDPTGPIATSTDLALDGSIKDAIKANLFDSGETKLISRFLKGGLKDMFDNVAHKPGDNAMVNKDSLESAIEILNKLLPTII